MMDLPDAALVNDHCGFLCFRIQKGIAGFALLVPPIGMLRRGILSYYLYNFLSPLNKEIII